MIIHTVLSYEDFEKITKTYSYAIVNISATWCKPCITIKPLIEKFISVIDEPYFIYIKIDYSIYEEDERFVSLFSCTKIPYFGIIEYNVEINKHIRIESFVSNDFTYVSKKIFDFIHSLKKENQYAIPFINDDF